jgi:hypothetical protein
MRLVTRACLTQEQQPPENFARFDYFLIQDSPGCQGMLDTGTATQTSRGRVGSNLVSTHPRGTRHRNNLAGTRISSIVLPLRTAVAAWLELRSNQG